MYVVQGWISRKRSCEEEKREGKAEENGKEEKRRERTIVR